MGTTPVLALRYPEPTDPADVPTDIHELATDVEAAFQALAECWKCLAEIDLAAVQTISGISQAFDHLRLVMHVRSPHSVASESFYFRLNGDGGGNYDHANIKCNNNVVAADQLMAQTQATLGALPGANATAGYYADADVMFPGYSAAGGSRRWVGSSSCFAPVSVTVAEMFGYMLAGSWRLPGAPITSIGFLPTGGGVFAAGSRAWLYGIAGA